MGIGISVHVQNELMFVNLTGELDQSTTQSVKEKLIGSIEASDIRHIVFNLKSLSFMDSSGIGIILGRYNQIKDRGGRVFVVGMNPVVSKVFYMSGLNQIITIIDDEANVMRVLEEAI